MPAQHPFKRRRVDDGSDTITGTSSHNDRLPSPLVSLQRDVSPPVRRAPTPKTEPAVVEQQEVGGDTEIEEGPASHETRTVHEHENGALDTQPDSQPAGLSADTSKDKPAPTKYISSPIQLTRIRDLPLTHNADTVSLHDILGHPLIKECWQFNYLHSIPFVLKHFDPDVRALVALKVVHGFWRNDDPRKHKLQDQADAAIQSGARVQLIAAHMPEMFGTHHTKMMVLVRHDGMAQVVIHTANMIEQDWTNLSQAVWQSPWLPLLPDGEQQHRHDDGAVHAVGSGPRFKADLLKYLRAYAHRTRGLVDELGRYDFSSVRAALVASTPSKIAVDRSSSQATTPWGWPGLEHVLSRVPASGLAAQDGPHINIQISSIATLTEKWIQEFLAVLGTHDEKATNAGSGLKMTKTKTKYNVIFPTAAEIRRSLDGYVSGASIHMKLQSAAQQKQLQLLKPMLCHWDSVGHELFRQPQREAKREAGRNRAAPHIKTYIRFGDSDCKGIDWAMVTSANLSQQAWGFSADKGGVVRIASYEVGVVVWPALFKEREDEDIVMVPVFKQDMPIADLQNTGGEGHAAVVGMRMPYDLPLVPYSKHDEPWCATKRYDEPDWTGRIQRGV